MSADDLQGNQNSRNFMIVEAEGIDATTPEQLNIQTTAASEPLNSMWQVPNTVKYDARQRFKAPKYLARRQPAVGPIN